ncbi:hypothetical protein Tco_0448725 [Tanacetum coccineum]
MRSEKVVARGGCGDVGWVRMMMVCWCCRGDVMVGGEMEVRQWCLGDGDVRMVAAEVRTSDGGWPESGRNLAGKDGRRRKCLEREKR